MECIAALTRREGAAREGFAAGLAGLHLAEPSDALLRRGAGEARPSRPDAVLRCAGKSAEAVAARLARASGVAAAHVWPVRSVVHWGEPPPGALVLFYFLRRRADLSLDEFARRYREGHAPLARVHHPGIVRYVQNFVRGAPSAGAPAFDAVAELHFASERDALERFYRDERSPAIVAEDVARFADPRGAWAVATRAGSAAPAR